jgi:hypothetical protein
MFGRQGTPNSVDSDLNRRNPASEHVWPARDTRFRRFGPEETKSGFRARLAGQGQIPLIRIRIDGIWPHSTTGLPEIPASVYSGPNIIELQGTFGRPVAADSVYSGPNRRNPASEHGHGHQISSIRIRIDGIRPQSTSGRPGTPGSVYSDPNRNRASEHVWLVRDTRFRLFGSE